MPKEEKHSLDKPKKYKVVISKDSAGSRFEPVAVERKMLDILEKTIYTNPGYQETKNIISLICI